MVEYETMLIAETNLMNDSQSIRTEVHSGGDIRACHEPNLILTDNLRIAACAMIDIDWTLWLNRKGIPH
jgi:hypothetical protein